jgi:hypothetical protein
VPSLPTATHALAEAHDTPESALNVAPDGVGVDWIDHVLPFHASARDSSVPELLP